MKIFIECTIHNSTKKYKSQLLRLVNALRIFEVITENQYENLYAQFEDILDMEDVEAEVL